ncbi:MAG: serine protease [Candidatus Paceibacterota bacterium]
MRYVALFIMLLGIGIQSSCTTTTLYIAPAQERNRHANRAYATVIIRSDDGNATGVCITPTHILSCAHVIGERDTIEIEYHSGERVEAKVVHTNTEDDLALLSTPGRIHPFYARTIGELPANGTEVYTVGHPRPVRFGYSAGTLMRATNSEMLISTYSNKGASGSGVWHEDRLIGILYGSSFFAGTTIREGSLCTPSSAIIRFLEHAQKNGMVSPTAFDALLSK